jgi:prepilin-type N-terminal cleavage/methylation domain-containing protein
VRRHVVAPRRSGFTLIELLVVIAIIAILIALLVPAVQKVREAAARTTCQNNLKQIALAAHGYHDAYKFLPQNFGFSYTAGSKDWSWLALILPYIEQSNLFSQASIPNNPINFNIPGVGLVCSQPIAVFRCPSDPIAGQPTLTNRASVGTTPMGLTNYKGVAGSNWQWGDTRWNPVSLPGGSTHGLDNGNGMFFRSDGTPSNTNNRRLKLTDIRDGTSNTFMVGEVLPEKDLRVSWAFADHATGTCAIYPNSTQTSGAEFPASDWPNVYSFRSQHTGLIQFALADASVRPLSVGIDIPSYRALCTIRGNEAVSPP